MTALRAMRRSQVRGDATVTLTNDGDLPVVVDDGRVFANGRTHLLPTVELAPGEAATVTTAISLMNSHDGTGI